MSKIVVDNADAAMTRADLALQGTIWALRRVDSVRRELKGVIADSRVVYEGSYRSTSNIIHNASAKIVALYQEILEQLDAIEMADEDYDFLNCISTLLESDLD